MKTFFLFSAFVTSGFMTSSSAMAVQPLMEVNPSSNFVLVVSSTDITVGAQNFISSMAQRGIDFLSDTDLTDKQRKEEFRELLHDNFDMKTLGRFSLGRYWRTATKAQREEYQKLFEEMIIDVYSSRFKDYKGQKFDVRSARSEGDHDAIVSSFIKGDDGQEIEVQWRVRYKDNSYRVVDVIVEGVSMAVTQRSDFASVIQRGGGDVQVLLAHLKSN